MVAEDPEIPWPRHRFFLHLGNDIIFGETGAAFFVRFLQQAIDLVEIEAG